MADFNKLYCTIPIYLAIDTFENGNISRNSKLIDLNLLFRPFDNVTIESTEG